jgi:hypothetical protein
MFYERYVMDKPIYSGLKELGDPLHGCFGPAFHVRAHGQAESAHVVDHVLRVGLHLFAHDRNLHLPLIQFFNVKGLQLLLRDPAYLVNASFRRLQTEYHAYEQDGYNAYHFQRYIHPWVHLACGLVEIGLLARSACQ